MTLTRWEVSSKDLCARFDPQQLPFETTESLLREEEVIGQELAKEYSFEISSTRLGEMGEKMHALEAADRQALPSRVSDTSDEDSAE